MTVAEVITKIGRIRQTMCCLQSISDRHKLKNGEAVTIDDAIDELDNYIFELESKIVK